VSNVVPSANAATQGPTTNKRSIKTNVLVENGQILVLGGLIDDQLTETAQKVPLLGDVPLLGNLFRYRNTSKLKRNLMVFLHPVILRDPAQGNLYTNDKVQLHPSRSNWRPAIKDVYLLPDVQSPVLKPEEEVKTQGTILNTAAQWQSRPAARRPRCGTGGHRIQQPKRASSNPCG
jgi:general secretion pathway protein D